MNRIYKVIWNRVKNCYVVVSEIANNRGKINGRSTTCVGTLLCILALVGGTLLPLNTANAVNPAGTGAGVSWGNGTNSGTDQNNVAIGGYAQALGPVSLALGAHSNSSASYSTAIGGGTQSTAENATAIGGVAKAQGKNATSIGAKAEANGEYATTIGAGAKADKTYAIAIGSLSHATEVSSLAMGNNSKATNTYAYAIGGSAEAKGRWSIAMGTNAVAEDDASVSIGTWSKATTGQSVAVGYLANAKQLGATALGRQTNASAVDATAIGSGSSSTAENGTAIGKSASVSAKDSVAIGTGAKATNENAVALGTGSETAAAVATASESVNGVVHNFAGINPGSTVSVGKTGMERTVTNVAAGRISATSTDAINGSQLYAVTTEVNKGTVYAGDVKGTGATDNKFIQRLGAQTNIVGGVADTSKLSDNNIGVVSNGTDTLNVKLAKELKDLTSVTAGDTVMNTDGVTITGGPKIVKTGIDAGNKQIVNVASGGDVTTNGANIGDINRIITAKDKYVTGGAATYQANGEGAANLIGTNGLTANVSGLKNNYVTSGSISNDGKVLTLERNDTGKVNVDLSNIFTEVAKGDYRLVENPEAGSQGKYKVDSNGNMVLTVANDKGDKKQVTLTDIASKAQQDNNTSSITIINTTLDKGLNFAGDTGAVSNRKLGDTVTVKGGATGALSDGNIGVESDGNGTLNVKLAKTLTGLDSVTAGNTSINNGGLTVGGKTYVSSTGLNANDQKITNVADGTVGAGSKDAVNGGQLHDAKNELNTNISNAKTELINKGLRFNADNNAEKTNKLGSKVTVNGDNNITTEITQTGDDTTIGVKLNKNLNVQTLTATDTVKAGGVTMGKHADTKNYVTGLDNKDWDVNTSNPVSGRAATEDQLKKISDVVKSQGAAATDYRLVKNAAAADGAYTVDSNGDVDLTVEDKNHAGSKETVKIKDVASKSKLDKVINDGLKFDANTGGEKTNKLGSKVSVKGDNSNIITSISQDANGDSTIDVKLGKDLKTETITATGKDGKDGKIGINGKDGVTTNISVTRDGKPGVDGAAGTTTTRIVYQKPDGTNEEVANLNDGMLYGGDTGNVIKKKLNNQVNVKGGISDESKLATEDNIGVVSDGSDTLKLRLAKELKGLTSATFTNGGNNTVINGDGMTINRAGGNAVSLTKDGLNNGGNKITNVADGTDPNDAVNKSQLDKATAAASTTVSAGNNITVTPSTNANGSKNYEVSLKDQVTLGSDATKQIAMDGTTGTIKAGDKVTIDGNKGTIKAGNVTIDGENGTIKAGDKVTIDGKDGKIAAGKVSVDGKDGYVTGLENKDWDPDNITSGRAATEDQLQKSHKSLDNKITNLGDEITKKGMNFAGNTGEFHRDLGQKVTIKGEGTESDDKYSGENIKTVADQNGNINIKMAKDLKTDSLTTDKVKVGKNGKDGVSITGPDTANGTDGKVAVTDKNGKEAVSISGKDGVGHIGLTGPAGTNGVNGTNGIDLSVKPGYNDPATGVKGEKGVDGTNGLTRIVYTDGNGEHQVATMEDGLQFTGNNTGTVNKQKLNSLVKVQGEGVTEAESTTFKSASGNINVKADGTDKLELQLAKDLKNLDSVTAAKTVKAGDAIMGGQTVNNAAGDSETGNYVTGLDNKDWDADKIVSGRAATEDQLKKALDAQSANSTDYRLIRNQAAGSNGDYTVDANGDVALTVQDKNHPNQTETVTIKDVASKSKLDKLNDRAVKYDLDPTGNPDKSKVTYEGPAYNNKQGGTHVTNVAYATGNDGSEAVNVDYLNDKIKDSADALTNKGLKFDANVGGEQTNKLGSKVTIKGEGTAADEDYSGENLKTFITQDQTSGDTTINVKMNKNLKAESVKVGKDGKDGVSITGPDTANGTDGKVAVTGKDGKEAVSISGKDGVGHIGLNGKDGRSADISVEKGDPDLNGNEITRIKYTDENGKTHQVATKDDGMAYGGDSGDVIKRKLNTQVNVKGGITDKTKLSNDDNIGVVSDGTDTLMLRLAKDLKGLNSVTFNNGENGVNGKTVVNGEGMTIKDAAGNPLTAVTKDGVKITDGPSMTKDGIDAAGKKVTNVQDGTVAKDSKDAVNGGQLHDAVESLKTKGFGLEAEDGQSVKKPLGETVKVKGDDTNIKTSVDGGAVKVELKKDITVDTVTANTVTTGDTKMDTNGVTIKDGANEATKLTKDGLQINDGGNKAVTINKDGLTIENGPKVTKDGIDAADKKITNVADGTIGAGSKDAVNGGQLHTAIEDIKSTGFGLKAEDGQSVKKPLGETIDLKGDGNIKTSVDNGAIKMALNDKITLGQDPAKQVNIDGSAGTITAGNGGNQVKIDGNDGSVTANTVKAGDVVVGKQTSDGKEGNFVTGLDNKTWNPENPVAVPGRAATEDQLKAVNDDFNNKARTGRVFQGDQPGDSGKVVRGLGDTMNLTGGADVNRLADNNIGVVKNAAGDGYNIKLAKDLKGLESVTTTDAAGNTTVMNGGGVTITPAQGNAVSLTKDGLNNGGNRITNVGPGVDGTDAVNVNQLSSAMRSVDGKIADVGATSAAISGLKPLQYDPLEPTQVLAAVGHYKGSTAAAVGVAHYTNESTMFHMGVSLGGHDNMINAGVSYKFGTSDAKKAIPARYKAGPISSAYVLQDEVTALKAENERMKQHDLELTAKYDQVQRDNEEMKAQIALLMQQAGLTK